jgi:hypothetical protein
MYIYTYLEDVKMITIIPTMDSKIEMAAKAMSAAKGSSDHQTKDLVILV